MEEIKKEFLKEVAETRCNFFREYDRNYARSFSRTECNIDVLNGLLLTLDPIIRAMRLLIRKKNWYVS